MGKRTLGQELLRMLPQVLLSSVAPVALADPPLLNMCPLLWVPETWWLRNLGRASLSFSPGMAEKHGPYSPGSGLRLLCPKSFGACHAHVWPNTHLLPGWLDHPWALCSDTSGKLLFKFNGILYVV